MLANGLGAMSWGREGERRGCEKAWGEGRRLDDGVGVWGFESVWVWVWVYVWACGPGAEKGWVV